MTNEYVAKNKKEDAQMVSSTKHQLALSGWLQANDEKSYNSSLKLQKFLLFYDLMLKNEGQNIDASHLRGYLRGPVYSNVWGDYTKERSSFDLMAQKEYSSTGDSIDEEKAIRADFLVKTMSEQELSEITHLLDLWKNKKKEIEARKNQVSLDIADYSKRDSDFIEKITHAVSIEDIREHKVLELNDVYFLFTEEDYAKLNETQYDTLWQLTVSERDTLVNPVYAEIDKDGAILIDD